jgi:outer membrane lipoprotein-sorting protein
MAAFAGIAGAALALTGFAAWAQDTKKAPPPGNPAGTGWTGQVQSAAGSVVLDANQVQAIKRVSAYFSELHNLRGTFVQTSTDTKRIRGRFYVKKPGRFRFDYAPPSKQVIVSDGRFLAIQDLDLGNEDVVELDNTPFRILLRQDVDLMRDALILEVQEAEDLIILSLQDRSPDAPGRIRLFMTKKPTLDLKEWVTTDAQGLDTRVEVSDLVKTEDLDPKLFRREDLIRRKLQQ